MALRLLEKLESEPKFAEKIGVEIAVQKVEVKKREVSSVKP